LFIKELTKSGNYNTVKTKLWDYNTVTIAQESDVKG